MPDIDYAAYGRDAGPDRPAHRAARTISRRRCDHALAADRPVVIDVRADPNVIALPPHVSLEQSIKLFAALAKGDRDRDAVVKQLVRQLAL